MNSKILVLVSVLVIGLGMYGIFFSGGDKPLNLLQHVAPSQHPVAKVKVMVARQPILKGGAITRDMTLIKSISLAEANQAGINHSEVLNFKQPLFSRKMVSAGSIILPEETITSSSRDYLDFIIKPDHIPFPLVVEQASIIGGVIHDGSEIDIIALSATSQNLATRGSLNNGSFKQLTLTPIFVGIKVLKITTLGGEDEDTRRKKQKNEPKKVALILELTQKQVATITVAKRISELEVHKSIGSHHEKAEMSANAGDVLEDYKAIKEYRAGERIVN